MAGLNTGDIVQCTFIGSLFQQTILNVLHYRVGVPSTTDSYTAAVLGVAQQLYSGPVTPGLELLKCATSDYMLKRIRVQKVNGSRGVYVDSFPDLPGIYAGACVSANYSAVVTKRSETANRRGVGSFHIAGVPVEGILDGSVTAAYRLIMEGFAATLVNPFTVSLETTQLSPVLWTRNNPLTYIPVTATITQTTIRTMRRRTVGIGI